MGRTSIPEYKPTRERLSFYPRTAYFKREKVHDELKLMLASGGPVDSIYLNGEDAILEHERRNGYDKAWGPSGVQTEMTKEAYFVPPGTRHVVV